MYFISNTGSKEKKSEARVLIEGCKFQMKLNKKCSYVIRISALNSKAHLLFDFLENKWNSLSLINYFYSSIYL